MTGAQFEQAVVGLWKNRAEKYVQWCLQLPIKRVNHAICGLLIVWLLLTVAQTVWLFAVGVGPESASLSVAGESPATNAKPETTASVDIAKLQSYELFGVLGEIPAVVEPEVEEVDDEITAAKTALKLTLEGVVNTPNKTESIAIIVYQSKQAPYYIGDKLPVAGTVTLKQINIDHVIIDNSGKYESLWLYDEDKIKESIVTAVQPVQASTPKVTDMRDDIVATELAQDYRERLYKNPSSLAEVLRISPAQKDGAMLGYRVSPGLDRQQFTDLGFKTNDVVTSINGISLDEPSKALEIYKLMRSASEANFTIDRNGESVDIMVSLGEGGEE